MTDASLETRWFPITTSGELPFRHVYHAQLLGQELAVWRADDGFVNVWENRCLHRGVRLSLGFNLGGQLKCQYHGWLYSSRNANCTYIPAHPDNAPARLICNKVFPSIERHGFIWSTLRGSGEPVSLSTGEIAEGVVLRSIPVNASSEDTVKAIQTSDGVSLTRFGEYQFNGAGLSILVQPVDAARSIIRGTAQAAGDDRNSLLRFHNDWMSRLRIAIESGAGAAQ